MFTNEFKPFVLIKNLLFNDYVKGMIYTGIGIITGSFLAYLLQYFLGRLLSAEDYGLFNALLSVSYIFGVFAAVFSLSLTKIISTENSKGNRAVVSALLKALSKDSIKVALAVFGFILVLYPIINNTLKVNSLLTYVTFALYMSLIFISVLPTSFLQGMLKYERLSLYYVVSNALRFTLPLLIVLMIYGLSSAFLGLALSLILSFLFFKIQFTNYSTRNENIDIKSHYRDIITLSSSILIINLCMTALSNMDLILVRKFFDPTLAGYYAGTVTLGKILLFGAGIVTTVMFPVISNMKAKSKSTKNVFLKFLFLQILVALIGLFIFTLYPNVITHLFFGSRFENSIEYLPRFSILVSVIMLLNFMVLYLLSVDKTKIYIALLPGVLIQIMLIILNHTSLVNVINSSIIASTTSLIPVTGYFFLTFKDDVKEQSK